MISSPTQNRLALRGLLGLRIFLCMVCALVSPAMAADPVGAALQQHFIWRGGEPSRSAEFTVFRKCVVVPEAGGARLHLFADARYVLWINGRYVERGPCRFDPAGPE
jgi:hypothetical protein